MKPLWLWAHTFIPNPEHAITDTVLNIEHRQLCVCVCACACARAQWRWWRQNKVFVLRVPIYVCKGGKGPQAEHLPGARCVSLLILMIGDGNGRNIAEWWNCYSFKKFQNALEKNKNIPSQYLFCWLVFARRIVMWNNKNKKKKRYKTRQCVFTMLRQDRRRRL